MKIEEYALIDGWLFVEKAGQSENPKALFLGADFAMHSLTSVHELEKEYRILEKLQPERLSEMAPKGEAIV